MVNRKCCVKKPKIIEKRYVNIGSVIVCDGNWFLSKELCYLSPSLGDETEITQRVGFFLSLFNHVLMC